MEAISILSATHPVGTKSIRMKAFCCHNNSSSRASTRKILEEYKRYGSIKKVDNHKLCASIIQTLSINGLPNIANDLVSKLQYEGFHHDHSTLSALMLCYANNRLFTQADAIWHEILNSSYTLDIQVVSNLIDAYVRMGFFNEVTRIIRQVSFRHPQLLHKVYTHTISCFGKIGNLDLMENTLKDMISKGFPLDSSTGNVFIVYYSRFASIPMMENTYKRLKSSRFFIEKDGIKAVSLAYIKEKKFHSLGKFVKDVGLGRRNAGNLLWNFLLLSYAANFKMKSLQREFLHMVEGGFDPDITTFNIRAVAFSKMSLFWDLHLSLEHMNYYGVKPDLVTYGCVVDAYLDRRLGRNLDFALRKMNVKDDAIVLTDEVVFEVLGKGDFHSSSEAFMEFNKRKKWSYKELIAIYLKKKYRSNQVFWNY